MIRTFLSKARSRRMLLSFAHSGTAGFLPPRIKIQAIDLSDHKAMSPVTQKLHDDVRKTVTFMENDDMMYERIEAMEALVESNELLKDCNVPFTI